MKKSSLIIYPRIEKASAKTSKIPIYVRVIVNSKKSEFRTNVDISKEEYDKWDKKMMRVNDRFSKVNLELNKLDAIYYDLLKNSEFDHTNLSSSQICSYINQKKVQDESTVLNFINDYYKSNVENNKELTYATKNNYKKSIRHINNFMKLTNKMNLHLSFMDINFVQDFKNYLTNTNVDIGRIGMKESSASTIIKKFRTIFNVAEVRELIKKNPFRLIKLKSKSTPKEKLNIFHIRKILELKNLSVIQETYRDIFLFSVYTGLSYIDAINLNYNNIQIQDNNNIKLTIIRSKTAHPTEQYLVSFAYEIINKYKNDISVIIRKGLIPKKSNKEINLQLKVIAEKASIDINLSHHIARHSFRQLLAEADVEDIGVIKRMMGHSRENDIDSTYYSITDSRLLEAKKKYEIYLNKHLKYTIIHGK